MKSTLILTQGKILGAALALTFLALSFGLNAAQAKQGADEVRMSYTAGEGYVLR